MSNKPICTDTVDELNERISSRNLAYGNSDVLLPARPQQTKYVLPFQNTEPPCRSRTLYYNDPNAFNPGDKKGSWSGFVSNVNNESVLRNQVHALQKFPQRDFVPNSDSDLYNSTIPKGDNNTAEVMYPNLFSANVVKPKDTENLGTSNKSEPSYLQNLGINLFNNDTRQQLKDS